jgi:DNA-binding transcriptional ArsR family regulator
MAINTKKILSPLQLAEIANLFAILSEPSRLQILQTLRSGARSVTELVAACELKQANVSKQLATLHRARLVDREREGNVVRYFIADPTIFALCELVCGKLKRDATSMASAFK